MRMPDQKPKFSMITDTARLLYRGGKPGERNDKGGFVVHHPGILNGHIYVGVLESGTTGYIVAELSKRTEVVGSGSSRYKTQRNEHVRCELYRMGIVPNDEPPQLAQRLEDRIDNDEYEEHIDTGYIGAHRIEPLEDTLEDVFKWYGQE